jgi:hypothetical protein
MGFVFFYDMVREIALILHYKNEPQILQLMIEAASNNLFNLLHTSAIGDNSLQQCTQGTFKGMLGTNSPLLNNSQYLERGKQFYGFLQDGKTHLSFHKA